MVKLEKTYGVEKKGTGRVDHIGKMTSDRVKTFKAIDLLPNEKLKIFMFTATDEFSLFPWVVPLLSAGNTYHLFDTETFLPMPYVSGAGYEFTIIKMWGTADQPVIGRLYMDTQLMINVMHVAGGVYNEQDIAPHSTKNIDPDFSDAHILDFIVTNAGIGPTLGAAVTIALLTDHGSDPNFEHKTKQVKCPICGVIDTVPISTTKITCSNGHSFIVEYHPWGGAV